MQAVARFRDHGGKTRKVSATGANRSRATDALKVKLAERKLLGGDGMTPETLLSVLAESWFRTLEHAPSTLETYRQILDRHVIGGLGSVRIREATTQRIERFLREVGEPRTEAVTNPRTGHIRVVHHGASQRRSSAGPSCP